MRVALCGNPNVGKTTLYNRLTRSDAPIGNWHGVTVSAVEKRITGTDTVLVDLPGTYSLTARSGEEEITRDSILFGNFDVCACVAEVNNLRRNLYILAQLGECGKKTVLIVNMMDEARGKVDLELLSKRLCIPAIGTSDRAENPKSELLAALERAAVPKLDYLSDPRITTVKNGISRVSNRSGLDPSFAAVKIMERDEHIIKLVCGNDCARCGGCDNADTDIPATLRYSFIDRALDGVKERTRRKSDRADKIILGKAALPIFLCVMAAVFFITTEAGKPLSALLLKAVGALTDVVAGTNITPWVKSLLCDGVITGVGSVLAFLPQVCILFVLTALLQDSGYMSRVAFASDGFFKKLGIGGRAAFSLLLGLGCSVTAVLSARGISEKSARIKTALVSPFVPCSARLAVFTALSASFGLSGFVTAALYVLGFAFALLVLFVANRIGKNKKPDELLMEMPPYRLPSARRVSKLVFGNVWSFIKRVGTTVFIASVIMWVLCNFSIGYGYTGGAEKSIMNTVSELISPAFIPLGFGNGKAVSALVSGIAAKETVVSVIASMGGAHAVFDSTASAVSFLIFTCLYTPCVATVAAISKEAGARYAAISVVVHTVAAYAASLLFYCSTVLFETNGIMLAVMWACIIGVAALATIISAIVRKHKKVKTHGKKDRIFGR